jgi:prepilin-type N-terminal cleavage/methylation domain-containing protein/prepilin-type processing-associated H-X9-DG protein
LNRGFTLIEILVAISLVALLAVLAAPTYQLAIQHAECAGCAGHMRALGIAFISYAGEHSEDLPGRVPSTSDRWPLLLLPYVDDNARMYIDPGDPVASQASLSTLLSNSSNGSSFFFNGFNDLGFYAHPTPVVKMVNLPSPPNLILLGQKVHGSDQFYMDFVEGNENNVLNEQAYFGGSNYTFADGSVRYMPKSAYSDTMWLVNQNYQIPKS